MKEIFERLAGRLVRCIRVIEVPEDGEVSFAFAVPLVSSKVQNVNIKRVMDGKTLSDEMIATIAGSAAREHALTALESATAAVA